MVCADSGCSSSEKRGGGKAPTRFGVLPFPVNLCFLPLLTNLCAGVQQASVRDGFPHQFVWVHAVLS